MSTSLRAVAADEARQVVDPPIDADAVHAAAPASSRRHRRSRRSRSGRASRWIRASRAISCAAEPAPTTSVRTAVAIRRRRACMKRAPVAVPASTASENIASIAIAEYGMRCGATPSNSSMPDADEEVHERRDEPPAIRMRSSSTTLANARCIPVEPGVPRDRQTDRQREEGVPRRGLDVPRGPRRTLQVGEPSRGTARAPVRTVIRK
jgi:hypothetical protein